MYWMTFLWPWPRSQLWQWLTQISCLYGKVRIIHSINTELGSSISPVMIITWFNFGGKCCALFSTFFSKFRVCFFNVKHSIGLILGMVGPTDMKRKGRASVGYWFNYLTWTFDLTHDHEFGFFKVKFWNSYISGIVSLTDVRVWNGLISRMERPIDMEQPGIWPLGKHGGMGGFKGLWPGPSDVGVLSIHLVDYYNCTGSSQSPFDISYHIYIYMDTF